MVLESLVGIKAAKKHPLEAFLLGILYTVVGAFLALWIFQDQASLVIVFLIVLASVPFMYHALRSEEKKDTLIKKEEILFKEHWKLLVVFMYFFIGIVLALTLMFVFLPDLMVANMFSTQLATIQAINGQAISEVTSFVTAMDFLVAIILNNIKVLFFCLAFSLFFGAGAIFILTWNATVISAAIGAYIRTHLATYASNVGLMNLSTYFSAFSLAILRYMTHGVFEILAYFIGGLAGGILSFAIINHHLGKDYFKRILKDVGLLILLALGIIFLAGFIEVFITPVLV